MRLNSDWRRLVRKAWSLRLLFLASLLTGCEAVISAVGADWLPVPAWARALVILVVIGGAFAARLVVQKDFDDDAR